MLTLCHDERARCEDKRVERVEVGFGVVDAFRVKESSKGVSDLCGSVGRRALARGVLSSGMARMLEVTTKREPCGDDGWMSTQLLSARGWKKL